MKLNKSSKTLVLKVLALFLMAASGQEKYIELSGYLNARTSAKFRKSDVNVIGVLSKGTRGEVIERKLMRSGNYGYKINVLNGPQVGKEVWVYYNKRNPDLALFDSKPQDWEDFYQAPAAPENVEGVETVRDTPALQDPMESTITGTDETQNQESIKALVEDSSAQVNNLLSSMRPEPRSSAIAGCDSCSDGNPLADQPVRITSPNRHTIFPNSCHNIMNADGTYAPVGNELRNLMVSPKYSDAFLKPNAMGNFCPNFRHLSQEQKLKAWTWFWMSLAYVESTCDAQVLHRTHDNNGKRINRVQGWGFWAMERHSADRDWRGRACQGSMTNVSLQIQCSVDIMYKQNLDRGSATLSSTDTNRYWGPAIRNDERLLNRMKRFELCY